MTTTPDHPGAPHLGADEGRAVDPQSQQRQDQARAAYEGSAPDGGGAADTDEHSGAAGPEETTDPDPSAALAARAAEDPRSREDLYAALVEAEEGRDEYLRHLQRLQAEFDNFRKRTMRDGATQRDAGRAELVGRLLDVLDDLDMALLSVDRTDDVTALHKGLELVYAKLFDVLRAVGLERVDTVGVEFDPERHEAVQHLPADDHDGEPVVAEVLRAGYTLGGRTLRAAMVKVKG